LKSNEPSLPRRSVVAGVEADHRAVAERGHLRVRGAPVGHVGVVESGLEELVLEHQALLVREACVDRLQRVLQAILPGAQVGLTGVVRSLCQPDLQIARSGAIHDVDAREVVVDRLAADPLVLVGQCAELVVVVLEGVGVDGADGDALFGGEVAQRVEVVDLIPRDVQRHDRRQTGVPMHLGRVRDLLEGIARGAGGREDLETGARVAVRPGRDLDGLLLEG
jgi:hypothetical protein